jgi:hypothetical protein
VFGDIPVWARLVITLGAFVAAGLVAWFVSARLGLALFGLAIVMLIFCERSKGEKSGYKF